MVLVKKLKLWRLHACRQTDLCRILKSFRTFFGSRRVDESRQKDRHNERKDRLLYQRA
jgi:hypothetical protein